MTKKLIIIIIILINSVCCRNTKHNDFCDCTLNREPVISYQDSIIEKLESELYNEEIKNNYSCKIESLINVLNESKTNRCALFPFSDVDSAIVFQHIWNSSYSEDRMFKIKCFSEQEYLKFYFEINNPLNFIWGECGTPVEEFSVFFYYNGIVIAKVIFSCEFSFLECVPESALVRFGGISPNSKVVFKRIITEM